MQEMPKGQRETCVNSKERMNEFRRDKKKKEGKEIKKHFIKGRVQPKMKILFTHPKHMTYFNVINF